MSDRPTWETDIHSDFNACMHREYCRELKRQRDAAVAALKNVLAKLETEAKAEMSYKVAKENFSDPTPEGGALSRAALAASNACATARAVLREIGEGK